LRRQAEPLDHEHRRHLDEHPDNDTLVEDDNSEADEVA